MSDLQQTSIPHRGFLSRLFGPGRAAADMDMDATKAASLRSSPINARHRVLLEEIADFLIVNDLEVNPTNLASAYNALTGARPRLARAVTERLTSGHRITQGWLDEHDDNQTLAKETEQSLHILAELESGIRQFASSMTEARSAATGYSTDLENQAARMRGLADQGDLITRMMSLTRDMVMRTRRIEAELETREKEAKTLRRRLDKVKRDAELDHLTGLPNRRAFEARFTSELEEARERRETLCIAICDIDRFKAINDAHGHDAGDRVLQLVAKLLAKVSDEKCNIARHGGEEFVLLFRGIETEAAKEKLDLAREALADRRLINRETDRPIGQVTFSAGISAVVDHDDPRRALRTADEALYRAKEAGRNQIIIA